MPQRPMTPMEKYRAGMSLTKTEKILVQKILERNRLAKINIGRKRSRGPAGMTLGEMKPKRKLAKAPPKKFSLPKKILKSLIKRKPKPVPKPVVGSEEWKKKWRNMSNHQRISAITSNSEVKKWYMSRNKRKPKSYKGGFIRGEKPKIPKPKTYY